MITAEIVKVDLDEQKAIRVWAQYKIDGVEVVSNYPRIDGKSVFCTRYEDLQFAKMNGDEVKDHIISQSKSHVEVLVRKEYLRIANDSVVKDNLGALVGRKVQADSAKVSVSATEEMTIFQDGTHGPITPKP